MARKVIPIATETHRDGTKITYCFEKSSGVFWSNISGFATGQNDGNRWVKLKFNTIEDLQADLKGKNIKWEDDAKTLFPDLQENKMKKLTTEQKAKVVKFAKSLTESKNPIKESTSPYTMIAGLREITDDLLLQTEMMIDNQYGKADHKQFKALWYKTANEFERKFGTIIKSLMKTGK